MRPPRPAAGWSARTSAARSARLSTIRNSSMLWILPPRTPIVSTTGTPQAAMLLPSHTPPDGCQAIVLAEVGAGLLDQLEQRFGSGVSGLGGRPKPPCSSISHVVLGGDRGDRLRRSRACAAASISGVRGRMLTRSTARSGTTLLGLPPSIRAGLTREPVALRARRAAARGRPRRARRCARPRDCGRHGPTGRARRCRNCRCPAARRRACRRAAPPARRSAPRACPRGLGEQRGRSRASRLPRRC